MLWLEFEELVRKGIAITRRTTLRNKLILVAGGAGYVGSTLVTNLLERGYKVKVLDLLMFGGESLLGVCGHENFELIKGDLRNRELVNQALSGVDAVIDLAALVGAEACDYKPEVTQEINFEVTKILVSACKKQHIERFIFASTCSNYGLVGDNKIVGEDYPLDSTTHYTNTKIASEKLLLTERNQNFHPCILRFAMMFGLSPKMRFNLIVNEFARDAVLREKVTIYAPEAWRAFTHVRDAAQAYLVCLEAPLKLISGEVFNVSTENSQKIELARLVQKYLPRTKVEIIEGKTDPRSYRIDATKIEKVLGIRPIRSVEGGFLEIKDALEKGVFANPYDPKYESWYDESMMFKYSKRRVK